MTHNHGHDDDDGHDHSDHAGHDHAAGTSDIRLKWALALTAGFMGLEVVAGLWSGSLALIADAGHMLTDAASLGLALYAATASRRKPDQHRTYGYGRARVLAAFVNGLSLLIIAAWIAIEAAQRLAEPVKILAGPMLTVAAAGLVVNIAAFFVLSGGTDLNSRGALAHVVGDLLGSVAAVAAAGIILWTGWTPADPLLSVAVAALIIKTGWRITKESGHTLLEGSPAGFDGKAMADDLAASVAGIQSVHHVHAWMVGHNETYVTLHVQADIGHKPDDVIAAVNARLASVFKVAHATVQVEHRVCESTEHQTSDPD